MRSKRSMQSTMSTRSGVRPTCCRVPLPKGATLQSSSFAVLRIANEEDWSVAPFGRGTRQHVGRTPERVDIVLCMDRLDRIEVYDPGDLTISVQAGASMDQLGS